MQQGRRHSPNTAAAGGTASPNTSLAQHSTDLPNQTTALLMPELKQDISQSSKPKRFVCQHLCYREAIAGELYLLLELFLSIKKTSIFKQSMHAVESFYIPIPLRKSKTKKNLFLFLLAKSPFLAQSNDHSFAIKSTTTSRKEQDKASQWCEDMRIMVERCI